MSEFSSDTIYISHYMVICPLKYILFSQTDYNLPENQNHFWCVFSSPIAQNSSLYILGVSSYLLLLYMILSILITNFQQMDNL